MDKIRLNNMRFYARHGEYDFEREVGQLLDVDVELTLNLEMPCRTDNLKDTLDFNVIHSEVAAVVSNSSFNLLETLAEAISQRLLDLKPDAKVRVVVRKPRPPIPGIMDSAEVEVTRTR